MATTTSLYISHRWDNTNITDLISAITGLPCVITSPLLDHAMLVIESAGYVIHLHQSVDTPVGNCRLLSMFGEGQQLLRKMADCIGGLYQASDSKGGMEMIEGKAWEENGLAFFLKYIITRNLAFDGENADELKAMVDKWNEEHGR